MRFDTPSSRALCPWATCFSSNQCRAGACRRGHEQLPGVRFCQWVEHVCCCWGVAECLPREIPICRPDSGECLVVGGNADLHTIAGIRSGLEQTGGASQDGNSLAALRADSSLTPRGNGAAPSNLIACRKAETSC